MLLQSPLSALLFIPTVAVGAAFLPALTGLWARRRVMREPAGLVALGWLVVAIIGLLGYLQFVLRPALSGVPLGGITPVVLPLLLLPPTLTWIGRDAKRWQWPAMAAWAATITSLEIVLGQGRELRTVSDPLMGTMMCALSGWAFASCIRRDPDAVGRRDWFWILTGHLVFFGTGLLRFALVEVLIANHWEAAVSVHHGIMLIYIAAYALIARGMLLRDQDVRVVIAGAPPVATPG